MLSVQCVNICGNEAFYLSLSLALSPGTNLNFPSSYLNFPGSNLNFLNFPISTLSPGTNLTFSISISLALSPGTNRDKTVGYIRFPWRLGLLNLEMILDLIHV